MNFGPDPKKKAKFLEKVKGGHLLNIVPTSSGREVLSYFEGDELIAYQLTDKIYISFFRIDSNTLFYRNISNFYKKIS